jgi:uncharacterized protein
MHFKRYLSDNLLLALKNSPVVLLLGARQVGKSTLMQELTQSRKWHYVSFDDLFAMSSAKNDPVGFIDNSPKPIVIDEIQRVPEIALPIKTVVDTLQKKGLFALTGSANPLMSPKLNDSLAGRMFILQLHPLAQAEILETKEAFLELVFSKSWSFPRFKKWPRDAMMKALILGGYPGMVKVEDPQVRKMWCNSLLTSILQRDLQDLMHVRKLEEMPLLARLLASRAAQLLNISELSRLSGIPNATLAIYLQLFEMLFLTHRLLSWQKTLEKKLTKVPKIYFCDTGLLLFLLGVTEEGLKENPQLLGHVLENFVVQEIKKISSWSAISVEQYHFRTQAGAGVDLILEDAQGRIVGIEIKLSETIHSNDFKGLQELQKLAGKKFHRGIVLYPGDATLPFGENMYTLPLTSLFSMPEI